MKAILGGTILLPDREITGRALLYDTKIVDIVSHEVALAAADSVIDAAGLMVAPGLIDTHVHGYCGDNVIDEDPDAIRRIAASMTEHGVTAFLPTTASHPWDILDRTLSRVRSLMPESREADFPGAEILGVHAEGPFLNPLRKGAMNERYLQPFDFHSVFVLYPGTLCVLTIAPEMEGGMDFIRAMHAQSSVHLSMGHTNATFEEASKAVSLGVTRATHLFNAMSPMNHRAPGAVGAALTLDIFTELIADTFHVSPALYPLIARLKGNRVVLITDTERFVGMPDGDYEEDGQHYTLRGHECRLDDGTIACSVLHLNEGVRNYHTYSCVSLPEAVRAASLTPAESIGFEKSKGSLTPGKDADIILMKPDFTVVRTIIRGITKFKHA